MPRYYFDIRHDDDFVRDDVGFELPSFQAAKEQAAKALAEIARDVLPGARTLSIEVRDDMGPVPRASLRLKVEHVRDIATPSIPRRNSPAGIARQSCATIPSASFMK